MSKKSLRVYFVAHEDGRRTGTLIRTWSSFFDGPPPSAYGATNDDVFDELEAKLEQMRIEGTDTIERYLWDETFATNQVKVEIHPLFTVHKRPVIGKKEIPLLLTYAYCKLAGGGYRVLLPRFGGSFVVEDLSLAPEVLRHAVSTALLGENARWVYDFRHGGEEWVAEWWPPILARTKDTKPVERELEIGELARVADDLVDRAAKGKLAPVVGELSAFRLLQGKTYGTRRASLLLVGPPGVGKTTLVRRLALDHLQKRREAGASAAARIWTTSRDRIIAGMVYLGMWQARCIALAKELGDSDDYLHVDALAGLVEPQPDGAQIADFFEPAMEAGELAMIVETTDEELERARRARPSFVGRFTTIRIEEPSPTANVELLAAYVRKKRVIDVHRSALKRIVRHLGALERGVAFPGKAFRFADWLAAQSVGAARAAGRPRTFYPTDASAAYSRYSGVPVALLSDDVSAGTEELSRMLRARVVGQDAACDACARVLARFKANLTDPERPSGTLLFVGPTGVGKTELAKQLARTTFGGEERMIRLDMSELMLPGSAARLLDVRPGVQSLASRVRQQPLSLVLLDEIEKAHAEIFDLLLGVLGEGRMTDAAGRFVDFRTTLIVMTSNIGVTDTRPAGFGDAAPGDLVRKVRAHFRPELFNRIDQVLPFRALAREDVERIVDLELASAVQRAGFVRRRLTLAATPAARTRLAELGYHATRGARPLKRLLEERVMTPIAERIAADPSFADASVVVTRDGEPTPPRAGHVVAIA